LRTHGGYAGVSDEELLSIPYARLLQAVRLASESATRAERTEYQRAAFVGWQLRSLVIGMFGDHKRPTPFGTYLRELGLADPASPGTSRGMRSELARAKETEERLRRAFRERGVTRMGAR
jgi:hypothetical protein